MPSSKLPIRAGRKRIGASLLNASLRNAFVLWVKDWKHMLTSVVHHAHIGQPERNPISHTRREQEDIASRTSYVVYYSDSDGAVQTQTFGDRGRSALRHRMLCRLLRL